MRRQLLLFLYVALNKCIFKTKNIKCKDIYYMTITKKKKYFKYKIIVNVKTYLTLEDRNLFFGGIFPFNYVIYKTIQK